MNWARGLFRLWVVATVLWLGAGTWMMGGTICPAVPSDRRVEASVPSAALVPVKFVMARLDDTLLEETYSALTDCLPPPGRVDAWWRAREPALLLLAAPPIGAFFLGCAFLWVARGFRPTAERLPSAKTRERTDPTV
jgi:hypothetical protein